MRTVPRPSDPGEQPPGRHGGRSDRLQLHLQLDDAAPRRARRAVADLIAEHPRVDDVILATSELVTNAVRHTGASEATLRVDCDRHRVRVVVEHRRVEFRSSPPGGTVAPSGRGLQIVEALVDRWGIDDTHRTRVWFEIGAGLEAG